MHKKSVKQASNLSTACNSLYNAHNKIEKTPRASPKHAHRLLDAQNKIEKTPRGCPREEHSLLDSRIVSVTRPPALEKNAHNYFNAHTKSPRKPRASRNTARHPKCCTHLQISLYGSCGAPSGASLCAVLRRMRETLT